MLNEERWRIIQGDALDVLRGLPDESAHCCVTSPPYWGLRDYGVDGQLGLEVTPKEYVARMVEVFREVRRVLRKDGTLWLNVGDSYAATTKWSGGHNPKQDSNVGSWHGNRTWSIPSGLKPKDLVGIPWRLAFALRQPYYTGRIKSERDRIWLACAIEAEGCIFIHKRKAGQSNGQGYERQNDSYGSGLEVANTSEAFVRRCLEIVGAGSVCHQDGFGRKQRLFRWNMRSNECRDVLREVYPYLVTKQQQVRLAIGCPSSGHRAEEAHAALIGLHRGSPTNIDFSPPETLYEPGWYLRSDVIWSKLNPMPESVTDRPTKAHEYVFLLAKSERYHYDAKAIKERGTGGRAGNVKPIKGAGVGDPFFRTREGLHKVAGKPWHDRNARSVWTITTHPFPDAHFAVMPEALAERCIMAGCPEGGVVLDPFTGAGTTAVVALRNRRRFVGAELNAGYVEMASRRIAKATRQASLLEPSQAEGVTA
jgi:DNA modification methylase